MKHDKLKILEFSDVHLGHAKTKTSDIIKDLYREFKNNSEFGQYDICFIAGDLFDKVLSWPDPDVAEIKIWMNYFARLCKEHDVVLRILEGTPSHDWKQSKYFQQTNELSEIGADIKFVDTLSIEHIDRFGIDVLYLPDEWLPEPDDIWKEVKALMNQKGIKKVDFSIMHGAFDYQLPSHVPAPTHLPKRYLDITRHLIFIGHIHKHSTHERIIAAGSFSRLTHNEEEAKGYISATVKKTGEYEVTFIQNEGAKIYKTVDCSGLEIKDALSNVVEITETLVEGSSIRVKANKDDPILKNVEVLRRQFPLHHFQVYISKEKKSLDNKLIDVSEKFKPLKINKTNITTLLVNRLRDKKTDSRLIELGEQLLKEHI